MQILLLNSIANIVSIIRNKIPTKIEEASSLIKVKVIKVKLAKVYKSKIKKTVPQGRPCRLSRTYVGQGGFI